MAVKRRNVPISINLSRHTGQTFLDTNTVLTQMVDDINRQMTTLDDAQTLTNKTLTAPTLATPAITGGTQTSPAITTPTIDTPAVTAGTFDSPAITTPSVIGALPATGSIRAHTSTAVPAGGTAGAGVLLSSTANLGVFFGSGVPTLSAAKGSWYMRTDGGGTNDRVYVNTNGGTTWTAMLTVA